MSAVDPNLSVQVIQTGAQVNLERAFNPSRSVRRGWAVWYRAPVLLTVIALLIIGLGLLADSLLREIEVAAVSELLTRLPSLPYGLTLPSIGRGSISPAYILWIVPVLILFSAIRALLDVISFRIHRAVIVRGHPSSNRDGSGVVRLALQLFGFYLLSFGAVIGSVVVAGSVGVAITMSGVTSGSPGIALFGMSVAVISVIPVWIYVSLGLYLGSRIVVFGEANAIEALERSWSMSKGHRWPLIVFRLILSLFVVAGAVAGLAICGVGIMLSLPVVCAVASASLSEAFLLATEWEKACDWVLPSELGEQPL